MGRAIQQLSGNMSGLSPLPYKGSRDYYPEDMRVRSYIFGVWRKVVQGFGYEAYDAPTCRAAKIYAENRSKKSSKPTYQFTDPRRPQCRDPSEMTQVSAAWWQGGVKESGYPVRWYSIAQFMRYEQPQRGREREFGSSTPTSLGSRESRPMLRLLSSPTVSRTGVWRDQADVQHSYQQPSHDQPRDE